MSDENKKADVEDNADKKEKSEVTKKPVAASKKVKTKSNDNTEKNAPKKKIIEKLQAMGVMSDGKTNTAASNDDSEKGRLPKILIASAVVALVAGSFVWALNKEVLDEPVASGSDNIQSVNSHVMPSAYPGAWQSPSYNPYNTGYSADNDKKQQQRIQQQRAQQQKWAQQQQQAHEQQRAQQEKWAQQQAYEQQWAEQQRAQQPYYAYPPNAGYQGQSMPPSYNYAPAYQQPGPYYGRQY